MLAPSTTHSPSPTAPAAGPWGDWVRITSSLCSCRGSNGDGCSSATTSSHTNGSGSFSWRTPTSSSNIPEAEELFTRAARHLCDSDWTDWLRVPLIGAASQGDLDMVRLLLKAGVGERGNRGIGGWMIPGGDGRTLLHSAADSGNVGVIDALLDAGAGVVINSVTGNCSTGCSSSSGFSPFHVAAIKGSVPAVMTLARAGAAVHRRAPFKQSALHLAAATGDAEMVYALVTDLRLAVEGKDDLGSTALHVAASHGKAECVRALLALGADVDARDVCGRSPLFKACRCGGGGSGPPDGCEAVRELLGAGADVHARSDDGDTPLHAACRYGNTEAVCLLLRHNADETARCDLKKTPWDVSRRQALRAARRRCRCAVDGSDTSSVDDVGRSGGCHIDFPAGVADAIHAALAAAPAGRAWRRRGWLVMLRARSIEFDKERQAASVVDTAAAAMTGNAAEEGFELGTGGDLWSKGDLGLGALAQDPSEFMLLPTTWTAMSLEGEKELLAALAGMPGKDQNSWVDVGKGVEATLPAASAGLQDEHSLPSPRGEDDLLPSAVDCTRPAQNRSRKRTLPTGALVSFDDSIPEGIFDNLNSTTSKYLRTTDICFTNDLVDLSADCSLSCARVIDNSGSRRRKATWDIPANVTSAWRAVDGGDGSPQAVVVDGTSSGSGGADDRFLELVVRTLEMADGPFEIIVGYV